MVKVECTKSDYCPCRDCDNIFVKVPDTKTIPGVTLMSIKRGVGWQHKQRADRVPEEVARVFYQLLDDGNNLGTAGRETNIGLGAAGELVLRAIQSTNYYKNPFKEDL